MKAVLQGKYIALTLLIKKLERSYTYNSTAYPKALEQKEANTPRRSRRQEIIKFRTEINQLETKRMIQQTKNIVIEKINKMDKTLVKLTLGHRDYTN